MVRKYGGVNARRVRRKWKSLQKFGLMNGFLIIKIMEFKREIIFRLRKNCLLEMIDRYQRKI